VALRMCRSLATKRCPLLRPAEWMTPRRSVTNTALCDYNNCWKMLQKYILLYTSPVSSTAPLKPSAVSPASLVSNSSFCIYVFRVILIANSVYFLSINN
jgi:hypothetical protein